MLTKVYENLDVGKWGKGRNEVNMMTYKKMAICWLCWLLISTFFLFTGLQLNAEVKSSVYGKVI
ncbi:MAG: hypothetical protein JSV88_07880, partial [Candidatus Aminicenantes bacterium]